MRERLRETERDRERQRQRKRERERESARARDRERERERETHAHKATMGHFSQAKKFKAWSASKKKFRASEELPYEATIMVLFFLY